MAGNRLSIFTIALLVIGFFFLTLPHLAYTQESISLGCCITVEGTPACVGCGEGDLSCAIDGSLCVETNSFTLDKVCGQSEMAGQALCRDVISSSGCCLVSEGTCTDNVEITVCNGQHWFEGSACSAVHECAPPDSSSLTDYIILILAIAIVIVLLILFRRKKPRA